MAKLDASKSGTFKLGGELTINRLGFGAMRITGKGIWGEPEDRPEALRTLKRVPELGINFIDTADSYGPDVSEELIHEALFPYGAMQWRARRKDAAARAARDRATRELYQEESRSADG
jgi:aryl-alcohol dehydrogenase-like predicted oxidoreductase